MGNMAVIERCVCGEMLCKIKHGKYREFTNSKIIQNLMDSDTLLATSGQLKVMCPACGKTTLFDIDIDPILVDKEE